MSVPEFAVLRRSTVVLLAALTAPAALSAQAAREDSTESSSPNVPAWRVGFAHSPVSAASAGTLAWTCVSACVQPAAVSADGAVAAAPALVVASTTGASSARNGLPFRGDGDMGAPSAVGAMSLSLHDATASDGHADDESATGASGTSSGPMARGSAGTRALPVVAAAALGVGAVVYATQQDGRAASSGTIRTPEFLPLRQPTLELDPSLGTAATSAAATVPEPAAMSLLLVGLAGLGAARRRRR